MPGISRGFASRASSMCHGDTVDKQEQGYVRAPNRVHPFLRCQDGTNAAKTVVHACTSFCSGGVAIRIATKYAASSAISTQLPLVRAIQ